MRITGGQFRSREIKAPPGLKTRPSLAKVRQALFNSIQFSVPDAAVLDLFSGSGALGIEALSRGAERAVFVEKGPEAVKVIHDNLRLLGVPPAQAQVFSEGMPRALTRIVAAGPFDLVLADPPYADGWELKLLQELPWRELLSAEGLFLLEWGPLKSTLEALPDEVGMLVKCKEKHYGDTVLTTYQLKSEESTS